MALAVGTRLGPYEVVAPIGVGGMGEVYRARDTRLDRTVAIKLLPPDLGADPDRRARFEREARTIGTLNHPHICTLHDVGEHDSSLFLVMEHLDGETLAGRLTRGPLPVEQALTIAVDICDALAAAHRQGIVHRDLKPSNAMLTRSGAKLLDFGVAKLTGRGEHPAAGQFGSVPTQSTPLTAEGMIVGTLQYMAPEQLEGKPSDARADLWALGTIVYEMIAGRRAFEGTSAVSVIAAILEREPAPISTLQPLTPPALDRLVRQCLAKSPDDRPDTAHDLANELRWARDMTMPGAASGAGPRARRRWTAFAVVGMAAALAGAAGVWLAEGRAAFGPVTRLALDVRPAESLNAGGIDISALPTAGGSRTAFAWTPDGRALVLVGARGQTQQLYVRALDRDEARPLLGTEGAQVPAVSADGRWVAFWAGGTIRKVRLAGGPAVDVAGNILLPPTALAWGAGGDLYFGAAGAFGRIWKIDAGGVPKPITTLAKSELAHVLPSVLPGGRAILYTARRRRLTWGDEQVVAFVPGTGEHKVLLHDAVDARYVAATGHLLFLRRGVLFAVGFDPERLQLRGEPLPIVANVSQALVSGSTVDVTGAGQFAFAPTGTLAWVRNPLVDILFPGSVLVSIDRAGHVSPLPAPAKNYDGGVRLSPDGRRFATAVDALSEVSLWTIDRIRGTTTPLEDKGETAWNSPLWTRDGRRVLFNWLHDGQVSLASQSADGTSPAEILLSEDVLPSSWTPDGQLAVAVLPTGVALVRFENGQAQMRPLPHTASPTDAWPEFSPDGHWVAYGSEASGRPEIFIERYPGPALRVQASIDGGVAPAWNRNGRELFFVSLPLATGNRAMMAAAFNPSSPSDIGAPRMLFEFDPRRLVLACSPVRCHDVSPDGQHFYAVQVRSAWPSTPVVTHVNIVQNWFEDLKANVRVGR